MPTIFYQNFNVHNVELDEHESLDLTDNDPIGINYNVDPVSILEHVIVFSPIKKATRSLPAHIM